MSVGNFAFDALRLSQLVQPRGPGGNNQNARVAVDSAIRWMLFIGFLWVLKHIFEVQFGNAELDEVHFDSERPRDRKRQMNFVIEVQWCRGVRRIS